MTGVESLDRLAQTGLEPDSAARQLLQIIHAILKPEHPADTVAAGTVFIAEMMVSVLLNSTNDEVSFKRSLYEITKFINAAKWVPDEPEDGPRPECQGT